MTSRRHTIGLFVVALVATAAMWHHPTFLAGGYDWRYFESAMEAARRNVVWFHEAPLYDPWMCGGEVQLANPQSIAGSPAFLLVVLFGTAVGVKLMLALFIALALDGTYRLSRHAGLSASASLAAALSFGLSGWFVAHFAIGHVSFFGAALIPYLIHFYRRAFGDRRFVIACGAIFAFVVAQGGNSTAVMAALALGAVVTADAIAERSVRPFGIAALSAIGALLVGAYRLFPALEFATTHPRHTNETDGIGIVDLVRAGFVLSAMGRWGAHRYALHEYAWRLPLTAWPLVAAGIVALVRRRTSQRGLGVAALALCIVGVGVAMGDALPFGPWRLMRHLPVLRDLRVPSRYILLAALGLSLCAGVGFDALRVRLSPRSIVVGTTLLLLALSIDGIVFANGHLVSEFALPPPPASHKAFYQVQGHWSQMLPLVYANRGDVGCDEEAPLTRAKTIDFEDVPQARLIDADAGRILNVAWLPNGYDVELTTEKPTTLILNTNFNEHYKADMGTVKRWGDKWPADRDGGRLAVELPPVRGTLSVRYAPWSFRLGVLVSLLSWLAAVLIALRRSSSSSGSDRAP